MTVLACVLHIGNVEFFEDDHEVAAVTNADHLQFLASMMEVDVLCHCTSANDDDRSIVLLSPMHC